MRIYAGKIPEMAEEIVKTLLDKGYIEVEPENISEVNVDIESVLKEYVRMDKELTDLAKNEMAKLGEGYGGLGKIKAALAKKKGFGIGEDAPQYIITQIIEMLFISKNVEEVYAQDNEITAAILPILKKYAGLEDALDQEVRKRIKNLQEGTMEWDIEYERLMATLKDSKKL